MALKSILHDNLMKIQGKQVDKIKSENKRDNQEWTTTYICNIGRTLLSSGLREEYTQMSFEQNILNLHIFHELAKL